MNETLKWYVEVTRRLLTVPENCAAESQFQLASMESNPAIPSTETHTRASMELNPIEKPFFAAPFCVQNDYGQALNSQSPVHEDCDEGMEILDMIHLKARVEDLLSDDDKLGFEQDYSLSGLSTRSSDNSIWTHLIQPEQIDIKEQQPVIQQTTGPQPPYRKSGRKNFYWVPTSSASNKSTAKTASN